MRFGLFSLLLMWAAPLFAGLKAPESVKQGQFAYIEFDSEKSLSSLSLKFLDKEIPCYIDRENSLKWRCLAAVPANAPSGEAMIEIQSEEGALASQNINILPTEYPIEPLPLTKDKKALVDKGDTEQEKQKIRAALGMKTPEKFWEGNFMTPVKGRIESHYGERRTINGKLREGYYHRGTDFKARKGTPMFAANAGKVILAGHFTEEGNMIMIDHGHGVVSAYFHCSKMLVREGQTVKKGAKIALVGSTGVANSDHLHLGIYINGTPIDPLFWLDRKLPY